MARGGVGLIQDSRVTLNSLRRSTTTFFRHETFGLFFLVVLMDILYNMKIYVSIFPRQFSFLQCLDHW